MSLFPGETLEKPLRQDSFLFKDCSKFVKIGASLARGRIQTYASEVDNLGCLVVTKTPSGLAMAHVLGVRIHEMENGEYRIINDRRIKTKNIT